MTVLNYFDVTCPNGHKNEVDENIKRCPDCDTKLSFDWAISHVERRTNVDKSKVFNRLMEYCDAADLYVDYYNGVAEPGYTDQTMVAADWNPDNMKRIYDFIERYFDDVSLEWSDEWSMCDECYKAIRTSPDSYSYQPYYILDNNGITCLDCVDEDPEEYIQDYINSTDRAIPTDLLSTVEDIGFECWEECKHYESGFHPGQNDTPENALNEIYVQVGKEYFHDNMDYLFAITGVGQFDVSFTVLVRDKETE